MRLCRIVEVSFKCARSLHFLDHLQWCSVIFQRRYGNKEGVNVVQSLCFRCGNSRASFLRRAISLTQPLWTESRYAFKQ